MVRELRRLEGFDLQVEEVHHIHKKDRPSGTALRIQAEIENAVGRKLPEPVAIRGGGVFGIHRIFAMSADETLTLEHSALNRLVFARGALRAAHWLVLRSPGLYTIENVIEP
jgi:4-hydroxy-tetrahydrodipicolinate reductase